LIYWVLNLPVKKLAVGVLRAVFRPSKKVYKENFPYNLLGDYKPGYDILDAIQRFISSFVGTLGIDCIISCVFFVEITAAFASISVSKLPTNFVWGFFIPIDGIVI